MKQSEPIRVLVLAAPILALVIGAGAQPLPERNKADLVLKAISGNLVKTNAKGGFVVGHVFGNADLNANGTIRISRVDGYLKAATNVGDIEIQEVRGPVSARTQAGNIDIEAALGPVFAQAEMGEIRIRSARTVGIQNIFGGDVKLSGVSGISKVITNGNILLVADEAGSDPELCNLATPEGDITLFLPESFSADLVIKTPFSSDPKRESQIESDFKFGNLKQSCEAGNIIALAAKINQGGVRINLYIEKGNIFIRKLKPGQKAPYF
jgi:DUF4097 and DUF4098 domain-containing protein YvlB